MQVTAVKNMLAATEMPRALDFYTGVFAFETRFESEYWSELSFGDAIIALHGGHEGGLNRVTLSIQVDDIHAATHAIVAAGGQIPVQPARRPGEPIIYAEFQDTEGNVVMLTQYVGE